MQPDFAPEISQEEQMLQLAIEAVEQGNYSRAQEILAQLLKTNQNNPDYWLWLSAAVDSRKERLYCLQVAYRLDPANAAARRGLILLGELEPDGYVHPFSVNHPISWKENGRAAPDEPAPLYGQKRFLDNPLVRIGAILLVAVLVVGGSIGGFALTANPQPTRTLLSNGTFTPTVTLISNSTSAAPAGSLLSLLDATYTPTPIYAATPHTGLAQDSYRGAVRAYNQEQWEMVALMMQQVATSEPGAVDAMYFVAESYRLAGKYDEALTAYQAALDVNPDFAPIYLGRARTLLSANPDPNAAQRRAIESDLDTALELDPLYTEAYLERGLYLVSREEFDLAQLDLAEASRLAPDSPSVHLGLARAELALGNTRKALAAAEHANQLDITLLDAYLVLGLAYRDAGDLPNAIKALETYQRYSAGSADSYWALGSAYYEEKRYADALDAFNRALQIDKTSSNAYFWRGQTYLALERHVDAEADFRQAWRYNQSSFRAGLGIARALIARGDGNNAYAQILQIEKLAHVETELAQLYYYRATSLGMIDRPGVADAALKDWQALLSLPDAALTAEMRSAAQTYLLEFGPSATPSPSPIPSLTPVTTATRQPTLTPLPSGGSAAPTTAPSPTPMPLPTDVGVTPSPAAQLVSVRQWAVAARASSEYSPSRWSASQAVGAPNTPLCGDAGTAWSPRDERGYDWLEVEFAEPVYPREVNIYITFNPNQVVQMELIDVSGIPHLVYYGAPSNTPCPFVLQIPLQGINYLASGVRVYVDGSILPDSSWMEVDAIEMVGVRPADE